MTEAIEEAAAALIFIKEHPVAAPAPPVSRPDFSPPAADRGRYRGKEITLSLLSSAFDQLAVIPGGDFGGLRSRIQHNIIVAANETLADIRESARREREEREAAAARARTAGPPPADR